MADNNNSSYTNTQCKTDLENLEKKLGQISREASVWDFYKIKNVVNNPDSLGVMTKNLLPGESLIINTPSFSFQNETYSRGDLIFKKNDIQFQRIAAERGGVYFPATIEKSNNNYILSFKFSNKNVEGTGSQMITATSNKWSVSSPSSEIIFKDLASNSTNAPYSEYKTLEDFTTTGDQSSITFSARGNITPFIKFYTQQNELIEFEYSCDLNSNIWTVEWNTSTLIHHVVVK